MCRAVQEANQQLHHTVSDIEAAKAQLAAVNLFVLAHRPVSARCRRRTPGQAGQQLAGVSWRAASCHAGLTHAVVPCRVGGGWAALWPAPMVGGRRGAERAAAGRCWALQVPQTGQDALYITGKVMAGPQLLVELRFHR